MTGYIRKVSPKVIGGKTQKKNHWATSAARAFIGPDEVFVERRAPGRGYKHVVTRRQVIAFLNLLPDWAEISQGLRGIVLDEGDQDCDGWHHRGTVGLCAWNEDMWTTVNQNYLTEHQEVITMLGVPSELQGDELILKYDSQQATAFTLMHVLLHELGHHHDRMTTRSRLSASRGEGYAERYANQYAPTIWERYQDAFGW